MRPPICFGLKNSIETEANPICVHNCTLVHTRPMKALVTGATGFVGRWLVRSLLGDGVRVRVLVRSRQRLKDLEKLDLDVCLGDVTDPDSVERAVTGCTHIFHLAGVVGYSKGARPLMEQVNVEGTRNVIRALGRFPPQRLIHMSSVTAVGASFDGRQPLNEDSPFNLSHLDLGYFATKRAAEELVLEAYKNQGLPVVIVNPSTIYGPGDAEKGSRGVQLKVAQGRMPFYTTGGVSVVDIDDLVEAVKVAAIQGRLGQRYILSGDNITIQKLFNLIATAAHQRPPQWCLPNSLVHLVGKLGDSLEAFGLRGPLNSENAWTSTLFHWFDHSKATKELNFHPRSAEEAIAKSVAWISGQENL